MQLSASNRTLNVMLMLAAFTIIVAGMKVASPIIVPIILSIFLATISAPPLLWLEKKGLPRIIALLIVLSFVIGIGILFVSLIGNSIDDFQSRLPVYSERMEQLFVKTNNIATTLGFTLETTRLLNVINAETVTQLLSQVSNEVGRLIANVYLVFFTVIFILLEVSTLPEKLGKILSESSASVTQLSKFKNNVQRYLVIKTLVSLGTAILVWILLTTLGVDFAILWSVFAFFLNFVPNIGSIIAAIPAVVVALLQLDPIMALWVALGYLIINGVMGNVVEPRIAGRHLGLSPLVVFLSLVFWGWVLGPVGMFLSVPLTMMMQLVAESSNSLRWLAILLSDQVN